MSTNQLATRSSRIASYRLLGLSVPRRLRKTRRRWTHQDTSLCLTVSPVQHLLPRRLLALVTKFSQDVLSGLPYL